jgi:hypothetical protein
MEWGKPRAQVYTGVEPASLYTSGKVHSTPWFRPCNMFMFRPAAWIGCISSVCTSFANQHTTYIQHKSPSRLETRRSSCDYTSYDILWKARTSTRFPSTSQLLFPKKLSLNVVLKVESCDLEAVLYCLATGRRVVVLVYKARYRR